MAEVASVEKDADHFTDEMPTKYSNLSIEEGEEIMNKEWRLGVMEEKILARDADESMIWSYGLKKSSEYLCVVDEVRKLTESSGSSNGLLDRAHCLLQMAMARLEEEFIYLLVHNEQLVEPGLVSFPSSEEGSVDDYSCSSLEEEQIEGRIRSESSIQVEEYVINLVDPGAVFDLKCIAGMMLICNYDMECRRAYVNIRKESLDKCLSALRIEKWSIEEILQMHWSVLNKKVKRWNQAMKVFIRVYLTSERHLCNVVLGDYSTSVREHCFIEISKVSIFRLLNFAEAIAIGTPKLEKIFRILDMYECLANLLPDVESTFPEQFGSSILTECHDVLSRLGETIGVIFNEFKNSIRHNRSKNALVGGGVHPITKYVMNYIKTLVDYSDMLEPLLDDQKERTGSFRVIPLAHHLLSIVSILESNLHTRSKLYKDAALQNIFLMNNIYYMFQKVKDSELRTFFGDEWIKENKRKFRKYEMHYERASWPLVLSFLKDEGVLTPSKSVLKDKFKHFNLAFEEVYRNQTAWLVPAVELREDLRISVSHILLQAYQTFTGRYSSQLDGVRHRNKYIKYSPDDLAAYILDLFEGSPKSLH
ncbi:putative exocyst complex component Exo70, cullin repeat-like-containing domain superfamily [Dioscorea sansibarensis]